MQIIQYIHVQLTIINERYKTVIIFSLIFIFLFIKNTKTELLETFRSNISADLPLQ